MTRWLFARILIAILALTYMCALLFAISIKEAEQHPYHPNPRMVTPHTYEPSPQ